MADEHTEEAFEMARDLFDDWQVENRGWNPHSNRTLKEWMEKSRGNFIMHWKESQKYSKLLFWLAIPTLILGAFVGVEGLESALLESDLSRTQRVLRIVSSLLTMTVAALANVLAFLDPKSKEAAFREASNDFSDISARLRFEYDRDWNHRTPHAILMRSVMAQMSEIKKNTPSLSETSIKAYQLAVGSSTKGATYLPDIMVPIGKMGEDSDPSYSWVSGGPRGQQGSRGGSTAKTYNPSKDLPPVYHHCNAPIMRKQQMKGQPGLLMREAAAMRLASRGTTRRTTDEDRKRLSQNDYQENGHQEPSFVSSILGDTNDGTADSKTDGKAGGNPEYDPHEDEEHGAGSEEGSVVGRSVAEGTAIQGDSTRTFEQADQDTILFS